MIYPGQPVPDLLPLEPPEYGRFAGERDEDELLQELRDRSDENDL